MTLLKIGEKIHVIHRQLFEGDAKRHFVGEIEAREGMLARVKGYLVAMDPKTNQFMKRDALRTRLIALDCAGVIINVIPDQVKIAKIQYTHRASKDVLVSDGSEKPYRARVRPPSFYNLSSLPHIVTGNMVADVVAVIGSLDIVLGEIDR